jgi:hypothetical protein
LLPDEFDRRLLRLYNMKRAARSRPTIAWNANPTQDEMRPVFVQCVSRARPVERGAMAIACRLVVGVAGIVAGLAAAAHAQTAQMQQAAQCVLSATKDTRSPLAVQLIRTACNDMVINTGAMYERQRAYDRCLIQQLSGAQSDAAALQIKAACRSANPL